MKHPLKSREVWVLGLAVLFALSESFGIDFGGVLEEAKEIWIALAPFVALLLRIFVTSQPTSLNLFRK